MKLECENCGYEPRTRSCRECHEPCPDWAKFCPHCGSSLARRADDAPAADPYAPENRRLCPDDGCIGILDENGRCTECGRSS